MKVATVPLALLVLAGCGADTSPPPSGRAEPVAPPPGPVLRFDGRYSGPITGGGGFSCRNALTGDRELVIQNGRARLALLPLPAAYLQGAVQADGSLRAADSIDRTNAVVGQVANDVFTGTWRVGACQYTLILRRTGGLR